jgi:hypothetical protein
MDRITSEEKLHVPLAALSRPVGLAIQLHYHPCPQSLTLLAAGRLRSRRR